MSKREITIRDIVETDIAQIKAIADETWEWSEMISDPDVSDAAIGIYLNQILYDGTFGKVAVMNDEVVGVIFGSMKNDSPKFRVLQENGTKHAITLLNAPDSEREDIRMVMTDIEAAYKQLISGKESHYDGTLDFIMVSDEAQGMGVGKLLWHELKSYFSANNATAIYVYTDTDCNYGFYEHSGFKKVAEQELTCDFSEESWTINVLMYEYKLQYN